MVEGLCVLGASLCTDVPVLGVCLGVGESATPCSGVVQAAITNATRPILFSPTRSLTSPPDVRPDTAAPRGTVAPTRRTPVG